MQNDDELLDLVNAKDIIIGQMNRLNYAEMLDKKLGYFRASDVFIVNSLGKVYVPIRQSHKTIAPNGFDYSAGGHVASGDSYIKTAVNETSEELGVSLKPEELVLLGKFVEEEVRYIRSLYVAIKDVEPIINTDDFSSAEWLDPHEVLRIVKNGHPAKLRYDNSLELLITYLGELHA